MQYAYSEMPSGANHSRLTSITYPSGYVLTFNYATGLNDDISRLSSLSDTSGTLESYSYLGYGTVVIRSHPQPEIDLTYVKQGMESNGDAGDQYTGLDRFGRVVDQRWINTSSGTATDRFQYGYDRNSNRLYRDNLVDATFGELYSYDGLNQLASFDRGTLNGTKDGINGTASRTQDWNYDALGNWDSVTTDGNAETRTANAQNEITSITSATTPTYDANGNMTGDETGRQFVYDAWNRLVEVQDDQTSTLETFSYDGLGKRVTTTLGTTTTDSFYSAGWQVLEDGANGDTSTRYIWSLLYVDAIVLRDRDTDDDGNPDDERLWSQQDANWNITSLVDDNGSVQERYVYDSFGLATVLDADWSTDADGISDVNTVYGFQGLGVDEISGLLTARNRSYSTPLGRFISPDPIRFDGLDNNLFRFVRNSPSTFADPSGLFTVHGVLPLDIAEDLGDGWEPVPGIDYVFDNTNPRPIVVYDSKHYNTEGPGVNIVDQYKYNRFRISYWKEIGRSYTTQCCEGKPTELTFKVRVQKRELVKDVYGKEITLGFDYKFLSLSGTASHEHTEETEESTSITIPIPVRLPQSKKL